MTDIKLTFSVYDPDSEMSASLLESRWGGDYRIIFTMSKTHTRKGSLALTLKHQMERAFSAWVIWSNPSELENHRVLYPDSDIRAEEFAELLDDIVVQSKHLLEHWWDAIEVVIHPMDNIREWCVAAQLPAVTDWFNTTSQYVAYASFRQKLTSEQIASMRGLGVEIRPTPMGGHRYYLQFIPTPDDED